MRNRTRTLVVLRLDVHVGGAVAQRLGDDLVDDLHDRRVRVDGLLQRGSTSTTRVVEVSSNSLMWCATSASAL